MGGPWFAALPLEEERNAHRLGGELMARSATLHFESIGELQLFTVWMEGV